MNRSPLFALTLALTLLIPARAAAQAGTVLYEQRTASQFEIPEAMKEVEGIEELYAQFPSGQAMRHILNFDEEASVMRQDQAYLDSIKSSFNIERLMESIDPEQIMAIASASMEMAISTTMNFADMPATGTYVNFEEGTYVEERSILNKSFLVTEDVEPLAWKLSGGERSFLGHRILKATATRDTVAIEAWFTPEIPVPAGPELYGGLPGLILVLNLDEDRITYTATSIDLESTPEVVRPTNGDEVSAEEFARIAEEKAKEMKDSIRSYRNQGFDF